MTHSIAKRIATKVEETTITIAVMEIRKHFHDADKAEAQAIKHRLAAGQKLLRLRERIEAGEAGKVSWWEWFEKAKIGRSRKDCERLMRIAGAEDPGAALEAEQAKDRERKRIARSNGADVRSRPRMEDMEPDETETPKNRKAEELEQDQTGVRAEKPRERRTDAQIGRDKFLRWVAVHHATNLLPPSSSYTDAALDLLTVKERADAIETLEKATTVIGVLLDRLKAKREAA